MIVHATDAQRRSIECGLPIRANINVLRYIPNNKIAAMSARIRFAFFIIIILYNESRL